jgi:hypothetical protein
MNAKKYLGIALAMDDVRNIMHDNSEKPREFIPREIKSLNKPKERTFALLV